MSDQNLLVNLVKKSVGLPTSEANCCSYVAPQAAQETANQGCGEQSADTASCCGSQESGDLQKNETNGCGCGASQVSQEETSKQCDEKKQPAGASSVSSCCG